MWLAGVLAMVGWQDCESVDEAARAHMGALLLVRMMRRLENIEKLLTAGG